MRVAAVREEVADEFAENDAERHRRDKRHHDRRVAEALDDEDVEQDAEKPGDRHGNSCQEEEGCRRSCRAGGGPDRLHGTERQKGRQEGDVAMREMDDVEDAEQQAEANCHEGVDTAEG